MVMRCAIPEVYTWNPYKPPANGAHEDDFGAVGKQHRAVGLRAVDEGASLLQDRLGALVVAMVAGNEIGAGRVVRHLDLLRLPAQHVAEDAVVPDGDVRALLPQSPASERNRR